MDEVLEREEIDKEEGTVEQTGLRALLTTWFSRMFGSDESDDREEILEEENNPELLDPIEAEERIPLGDEEPVEEKKAEAEEPRDKFIRSLGSNGNNSGGGGNSNRAGHGEIQSTISDGQEQEIGGKD